MCSCKPRVRSPDRGGIFQESQAGKHSQAAVARLWARGGLVTGYHGSSERGDHGLLLLQSVYAHLRGPGSCTLLASA